MAVCTDNPRVGIIGCGASFSGELQHSVAKVSWSTQPDGRAHVTASAGVIDGLWRDGSMRDPAEAGLEPDDSGRWRRPMSDADRERLGRMPS